MPMRQPPWEFFARAGSDEAGAVRADEPGLAALHGGLHPHHVIDGDALGDGDDEVEPGIDRFEDGVGRKGRRHEDGADRGAASGARLRPRYRRPALVLREDLAAFAGGDAGDDLRAVVERKLGVGRAEAAGDALHEDAGLGSDEDGHNQDLRL